MVTIVKNEAAGRFELEEAGLVAFADYRRRGDTLIIDHVEAPPPLRGAGTAGRLMTGIAEVARSEGLGITPLCGYAARWLRLHEAHGGSAAGMPPGQAAGR